MGRHSRKGPRAKEPDSGAGERAEAGEHAASGGGRRRRAAAGPPPGGTHAPFHDIPQARGGHPEQREPGGGWGAGPQQRHGGGPAPAYAQWAVTRQVSAQQAEQRAAERRTAVRPPAGSGPLMPGPRREFVDAFDSAASAPPTVPDGAGDVYGYRPDRDGAAGGTGAPGRTVGADRPEGPEGPAEGPDAVPAGRDGRGGKGRTFTGIAAAAVTTVLAVVVAGQVAQDAGGTADASRATGVDRDGAEDASRSDGRPTPQAGRPQATPEVAPEVEPLSYEARMAMAYPLAPTLKASGKFEAFPGMAKAPGKGHKYRYRVDVEKGLGLDAALFAEAVQKTLNDERSWAHNGAMTFERISSGEADFVITLASPGTTGVWCRKSGLDTTQDNVSCDSAATDRVMINGYRWAQGASTFGPKRLFAYRQMLINHEIGHRLGYNHVNCRTPGALAPVMQQQTKTLDINGVKCRPNAWVHPGE